MKKMYLLLKLVTGMILLVAAPPLLCHADINQISYTANYNGTPVFGTDTLGSVIYTTISYGDLTNSGAPGEPSLPIDYIRFSVPYNATNFTVTAIRLMNQPHYLDHLPYPCQTPRLMNDTTPVVITLPDTAAYYSGTSFPSTVAWVVDEGFLDGENHIVTVAVMPFSYGHTATSDVVGQWKRISLLLRYSLSDSLAMYPIPRNDNLLREKGYQLTQNMVVNPSQVKSFAPSQNIWGGDSLVVEQGGSGGFIGYYPNFPELSIDTTGISETEIYQGYCPYLIVTTSEFSHSLRRFVALKRQKGYNVKVVTMNQVKNDPFARAGDRYRLPDGSYQIAYDDDAGKLRQFLKKYYSVNGTQYVLLAGNGVPFRTINHRFDHVLINGHGDLYFSDINANWLDTIDLEPDLFVGRLLGNQTSQFDAYTEKVLKYELNPGNGDHSYLKTALFTESNSFFTFFINGLRRFKNTVQPIFTKQVSLIENPNNNYPKGNDVIDSIQVFHPALMCSFNHGGPSHIKIYGSDNQMRRYFILPIDSVVVLPNNYINTESGNGLNRMNNKDYPMIYYSLCCQTMPFYKLPDCNIDINYGESFTMGKDYGGPVYMGNTNGVIENSIERISYSFSQKILAGDYILGHADAISKKDDVGDFRRSTAFYHNFLGDPSLEIWTDMPMTFSGIAIARGDSSISVSGVDSDATIIAYCDNKGNVGKIITSSDTTINHISPNSTIMLYKHNYIPYIAPLMLQNLSISKSQYIIADEVCAGRSIDTNRTSGDVIINNGTEYEIEAKGRVSLHGGFKVERGAKFTVHPSDY